MYKEVVRHGGLCLNSTRTEMTLMAIENLLVQEDFE